MVSSRRAFSSVIIADSFEAISRMRCSERSFSPCKSPSDKQLLKILQLTQLAPSSFNLQPYKGIVVQSDNARELLASCMLGGNQNVVSSAPITVIFIGDIAPTRSISNLLALETKNGSNAEYVQSLAAKVAFLYGSGKLSTAFRSLATHLLSPLSAAPKISRDNEPFACKNTAFAGLQFMLAATSLGLSTCPMEGFDERRICSSFNIPMDNYVVPFVVALGFAKETKDNSQQQVEQEALEQSDDDRTRDDENRSNLNISKMAFPDKARFELKDMFFSDSFGQPLKLIK